MATVYIYALRDPRSDAIRYIGKTKSLRQRLEAHAQDAKSNKGKAGWFAELAACGLTPEMVTLQVCDSDTWRDAEIAWIAKGRAAGWPLFNITDGGEEGGKLHYGLFFFRGYLTPELWNAFIRLDYKTQIAVCTQTAQAMVETQREKGRAHIYPVGCVTAAQAVAELRTDAR